MEACFWFPDITGLGASAMSGIDLRLGVGLNLLDVRGRKTAYSSRDQAFRVDRKVASTGPTIISLSIG
jgi:hypothetical protein